MKSYIEFITEVIHQTHAASMYNTIFDTLAVGDFIKLSKKGGELIGYCRILDKYNANRSLPGEDTMEVLLVDEFNKTSDSPQPFSIIKEDMSYDYSKIDIIEYIGLLFEYNEKVFLIQPRGKDAYEHITTTTNGDNDRTISDYILKLFGFRYTDKLEDIQKFEFFQNDILKIHNYSIVKMTKDSFEKYFDKYKLSKNDINGEIISNAQFFKKEEAIEKINKNFALILN